MFISHVASVRSLVFATSLAGTVLLRTDPSRAASLQKVEQSVWGISGLPSYVNMYIYVPEQVAVKPPVVVGAHWCTGNAAAYFSALSLIVAAADTNGFIMIFPEATGRNCWDVGSPQSLTHDGGGDTHAIAQMVRYTISTYNADASRVYAVGTSSGAMMTQALLGVYPDMFMAGSEFSGVPCGCWAVGYSADNGQWSLDCASGLVTKTASEWGDLVRSMYPGYTGHRPRIQLWHGTADDAIDYTNFLESIKEFTNLLGLPEAPTSTDTPLANYTHQLWSNSCGFTVVDATSITNGTHNLFFGANAVLKFFGLDQAGGVDPETAACGSNVGNGGSSGSPTLVGDSGIGINAGSSPAAKTDTGCGCRSVSTKGASYAWFGILGLSLLGRARRLGCAAANRT